MPAAWGWQPVANATAAKAAQTGRSAAGGNPRQRFSERMVKVVAKEGSRSWLRREKGRVRKPERPAGLDDPTLRAGRRRRGSRWPTSPANAKNLSARVGGWRHR